MAKPRNIPTGSNGPAWIQPSTRVGAAAYYYARRRRRGLQNPASVLFVTHRYTTADTSIATSTVFGDSASRSRPVTFSFELSRSAVGSGVVFEFGSATRGVAVWVSGNNVGVAAGSGTATPGNGVTITATNALPATGQRFQFTVSVSPGDGRVELFRNGALIATAQAAAGNFGGEWADANNGSVGNFNGTVNDRVPVGERVALSNAALIGPLKVYLHQKAGA